MSFFAFTKEEIADQASYEPIPNGKYIATVMDHAWKPTKAGHMLVLTYEITGPEHVGRRIWENYNLDNPSLQAQQIAVGAFKALCNAAGNPGFFEAVFAADNLDELEAVLTSRLADELYNREVEIYVGTEKATDEHPAKNKVKSTAPAKSSAAAKTAKPRWMK